MTGIGEQQPRLSDYCPVCKELMWNTENVGHICLKCVHLDGAFRYNPKTGEEYGNIDLEILNTLGWFGWPVQGHLRDAGIEADLIGVIKKNWDGEESRTRITRLFSAITWPQYDRVPGEGTFEV